MERRPCSRDMTAGRSPFAETILAKCSPIVSSKSGGEVGPLIYACVRRPRRYVVRKGRHNDRPILILSIVVACSSKIGTVSRSYCTSSLLPSMLESRDLQGQNDLHLVVVLTRLPDSYSVPR